MTIDELGAEIARLGASVLRLEAKVDRLVQAQPKGRLLSQRAASRYLGIGRDALRDLTRDRAVLTVKTPSGSRYALAELDRYVESGARR